VMPDDQGVVCGNEVSGTTLAVGTYKTEDDFSAAVALGECSSTPGRLDGFSSSSAGDEAGVNGSDSDDSEATSSRDSEDEIFQIESNDNEGKSGMGQCGTVLGVA
ncbi:hypothetical protein, partial [Salmonella sp. s58408]|uniref:hypothetical protein n=1 Tax=Salmonella sp. s58408 TaxID=3159701 RepID=UPI00398169DF